MCVKYSDTYKKNRKVSAGAEKWLDVEMWENTGACIATLKARGYRIPVTHIASDTVSIHDMDWRVPTAVFFGNEHKGVSAKILWAIGAKDQLEKFCSWPCSQFWFCEKILVGFKQET
jgi:tRNA G18 (ribose-2'-O)-methylase SpoU